MPDHETPTSTKCTHAPQAHTTHTNVHLLQTLYFWAIYAGGFITRPIGALLFGHVADDRSRKLSLLLSIALMAVPTVLVGCLPTYAQVGLVAPVLLAILRIVQGLSLGGEFSTAMLYITEVAPPQRQGLAAAFMSTTSAVSAGCDEHPWIT